MNDTTTRVYQVMAERYERNALASLRRAAAATCPEQEAAFLGDAMRYMKLALGKEQEK